MRLSPAIYKWQIPVQYAMMDIDVTIDKSGRLVLPKPVRDALGLRAGDRLKIRRQGSEVILSFSRPKPVLQKEKGVWVYRSGQTSDISLPDLIEQERRRREAELS
jgi:AbrB family looped-hinge helix DNA binding protein